jgi:hypothetical protein
MEGEEEVVDPGRITLLNDSGMVPMAVDKIQFSLMSPQQMADAACLRCNTEELYTVNGAKGFVPVPGGVLDLRLGTSNKGAARPVALGNILQLQGVLAPTL